MTSKELNKKIIELLPEIQERYIAETSWQDGDGTGSHIICEDVLVPWIKEQIEEEDEKTLKKVFEVIDELLNLGDEYANEVVVLSIVESLLFDEEIPVDVVISLAKEKMRTAIFEVLNENE